ncbi:hypothetical protein [Nitrosomonas ureae]|nr:hypothetical protein [Nitrosomonas ureae]
MNEGTDVDIIDHTIWNGNYVFNMATGTTNFAGESFKGFENAIMGNGSDTVTGNAANNSIKGGAGADVLKVLTATIRSMVKTGMTPLSAGWVKIS